MVFVRYRKLCISFCYKETLSRSATMKNHFNYERPVCLYHGTVFKLPFEGTYIESPLKSQLRVRFKMEIQDNARMRTAYLTAAW